MGVLEPQQLSSQTSGGAVQEVATESLDLGSFVLTFLPLHIMAGAPAVVPHLATGAFGRAMVQTSLCLAYTARIFVCTGSVQRYLG